MSSGCVCLDASHARTIIWQSPGERATVQYRLDTENDTLNALERLEGLRPVVASRAGEQHDHFRKGVLQFGHVPVFGTRARKFRASLFADARVTAQATRRQGDRAGR